MDGYGKAFGLQNRDELRLVADERDELGMDHVRFQQTYRGVPVTAAEVVVHLREGGVSSVSANALDLPEEMNTTPTVAAATAADTALALVAKLYGGTGLQTSEPRLEVFAHGLLGGPRVPARLAWFVEVTRIDVREFVWVDAERGMILLNFKQLTNGRKRYVHTSNDGSTLPGTLLRSEGGRGGPGSNHNSADANAAYDYSGDTYDYFWNEHGRDSYDGKGAAIRSTVHYCVEPKDYPAAARTRTPSGTGRRWSTAKGSRSPTTWTPTS